MYRMSRKVAALSILFFAVLFTTGCFETSEKSWRKIRIFYTSDILGTLEPSG